MASYQLNLGYDYSAVSPGTSLQWGVVASGANSTLNLFKSSDTLTIQIYDLTTLLNPTYTLPDGATGTSPIAPSGSWMTFSAADGATSGTPFTVPTSGLSWVSQGSVSPSPTWPGSTYPAWQLSGFSISMASVTAVQSWMMTLSIDVQLVNANGPIPETTVTFGVDPEMIVRPT